MDAARAREVAARPILPSNPEVEFALGARRAPSGGDGTFWSARLSQELEIAGQRGLRREEAGALVNAQGARLLQARRTAAAEAWLAYFELSAAERQQHISERFEVMAKQVRDGAKAMSESGLLSPVDADLAQMSWSQARQAALSSQATTRRLTLQLATLVGTAPGSPAPDVSADLEPLRDAEAFAKGVAARGADLPEARALQLEQQALRSRAALLRRSRVPNLTLSAFFERDKFEGRLVGGAASIPLPLPEPVGRTASGEIAESEALASRSETELRLLKRRTQLQVAQGLAELEAKRVELGALDANQVALAERNLEALGNEVRAGRIPVRDALVSQDRLLGFLRARVEAELALAVASVELARVSGFPLERSGS